MEVQYTNSWYDPVAEGEAANALMARGCVIIGQHADSTGAPSAVQAQKDAGTVAYSVGYNIDMLSVAPTAALTSAQNNWSVLYQDTLEKFIAGEEIPADYAVGSAEDAVMISTLGAELRRGHPGGCGRRLGRHQGRQPEGVRHLQVHLPARCRRVLSGGRRRSCDICVRSGQRRRLCQRHRRGHRGRRLPGVRLRSAPYFSLRIDGITELNNN